MPWPRSLVPGPAVALVRGALLRFARWRTGPCAECTGRFEQTEGGTARMSPLRCAACPAGLPAGCRVVRGQTRSISAGRDRRLRVLPAELGGPDRTNGNPDDDCGRA